MTTDSKDTIYIDVDDEITAIIDKLRGSNKKIVALVLPKRAAVLQSVVNMKLLKRAADQGKKNLVLVTSESALMPLAGAVGVYVAKTPQSKPEIPPGPGQPGDDSSDSAIDDKPLDTAASVGALATQAEEDDAIDVDNSDIPSASARQSKDKKPKAKKSGDGKKKLKIPNFEKFRSKLFLGIAAGVLLIVFGVLALVVLPKATITLKTDTTNVDTTLNFTADPAAKEFDQQNSLLSAINKEYRKTDTEKVAATGQKDIGTKATGSVSLKNCVKTDGPVTIAAGTTVSTSNLAYTVDNQTTLPPSSFSGGGNCNTSSVSAAVTAQNPGDKYNIESGKTFTVSGYSSVSGTNDSAMSGGTSKIIKIVSQQDLDTAKQRITERAASEAPEELKQDIEKESYMPLKDTMTTGSPTMTSTPNVGDEAAEVTVTSTTAFTMLGVKEDDLKKLVEDEAKKKIDPTKQMIQDNGIDNATFRVQKRGPGGNATMSIQTLVVAGPELDAEGIKKEIAGKKRGEVQSIIKQRPGIQDVEVAYSPFWVQSTPKSTSKIKIIFESKTDNNN